MKYSPDDIMGMKYHIIKKRIDQYMKYKKEVAKAMEKSAKKITNK